MKKIYFSTLFFMCLACTTLAQNAFNIKLLTNAAAETLTGITPDAGKILVALSIEPNRVVPVSGKGDWSGAGSSYFWLRIPIVSLTPTPVGNFNTTQITNVVSGNFTELAFSDAFGNAPSMTLVTPADNPPGIDDGFVYFSVSNTAGVTAKTYAPGSTFPKVLLSFQVPNTWKCATCIEILLDNNNNMFTTASLDTRPTLSFTENGSAQQQAVIVQNNQPLPIVLVSFDAAKSGSSVKLNWLTSSEINAKGYDVERSGNGIDFTAITNVPAVGSSNYSSIDASPLSGVNYYRLKMIDIDGKFKYSNVRTVLFDGSAVLFDIYPNPVVTSKLYLHLQQNNYAGKAQAIITDIAGRSVQSININVVKGNNQMPISVNGLSTGTYFVTIYDASGVSITESKKLVKQ